MKEYMTENNCITISSKNGNALVINREASDLSLTCTEYNKGNVFYITRANQLYIPMKLLFREIKKVDKLFYLKNNQIGTKFEWISDGDRHTIQNRLIIIETIDGFRMQFIKNNSKDENNCTIHFSFIKSNNLDISHTFDKFACGLMNMLSIDDNKTNKR